MGNDGNGGRKLSVARELFLLAAAVEALRLAAEQKLEGSRHRDKASDLAPVLSGGLHVLRDRLHLVAQILTSAVNASEILSEENEAGVFEEGPGVIREWSADEKAQHLEAEWRLACSRRFLERPHEIFSFARNKKPNDRSN